MNSSTTTHQITVNNSTIAVETATGNTRVSVHQLLSETTYHPHSYALFVDAYDDSDDGPSMLEERAGERVELGESVDVSERQKFVALLKRELPDELQ